jgi:choline dehydrogenase
VLGGSSSINGMIYMRGQQRGLRALGRGCGDDSWRWDQVLPLFKKSEDHYLGASDIHGAGGEWRVEKQRLSWKILDAFRDAAAEAGIEKVDDFNTGDNAGSAYFEVNQRRGIRLNTAKAFLKPAAQRPNLTIMTGCHVERLLLETTESGTCLPRRAIYRRRQSTTRAKRAAKRCWRPARSARPTSCNYPASGRRVTCSAMASHPSSSLPGVGENLQDHLQLRMVYKVQGVKTLNTSAASWFGKMKIGLEYAFLRSGPMSMAPSQLGAFAKSGPQQATPNLQYHVQPLSLEKFGDPLHGFPAFTASVCNLRPTARGHVRLSTHDSYAPPKITPNYLSTMEDRQTAAAALR